MESLWLPCCTLAITLCILGPPDRPPGGDGEEEITRKEIRDHVGYLASDALQGRAPGTDGWRKAAAYVEKEFRSLGLLPAGDGGTYFQEVGILGKRGRNILGLLPGESSARGDEVVILSAHYDHLGVRGGEVMNGADDDASGVAILLEVAEALAGSKEPLERSVLFACFDLEESGLLGAMYYVNHPTLPLEKTVVDINLEVLGNDLLDGIPDSLFAFGTEYDPAGIIRDRVESLSKDAGLDTRFLSHALVAFRSDHRNFVNKKVPFLFLAAGTTHTYHKATDDPETLNYPKLEKEGRLIRDLTASLARGEERPRFQKPPDPLRLEDARVLGDLIEVMLEETEGIPISEEEKVFLRRSAGRIEAMTRTEDPVPFNPAVVGLSFVRSLEFLTRPRVKRSKEF